MTQQHTRNITLTKSTFFLCQCRTSEVTINTLPTWRSFQRFPLCLILLFPGYMEDNDSQPSYGCPPHKLSSSWWLTMIDGYVWFAADRMPLTRSSQLPFRECCLGTVPYLSAYVWWAADFSKNNMSSLFMTLGAEGRNFWVMPLDFCDFSEHQNKCQFWSTYYSSNQDSRTKSLKLYFIYIYIVGGRRDRISHSHVGLKLTV